MPEHLRALIVVLFLAWLVLALSRAPACDSAISAPNFDRRRNIWFGITLALFLAHNFWLFVLLCGFILVLSIPREKNLASLYIWLIFAAPGFAVSISGFGLINQLFELSYPRLLTIIILIPAALRCRQHSETKIGLVDLLLAGYLILPAIRQLQVDTFTNTARWTFYAILDIWLPYYVISRSVHNLAGIKDIMMSASVALAVVAVMGIFEFLRYWLLYGSLSDVLGVQWGFSNYLARSTSLRAQVTTGHPIALGYILGIAVCFHLALRHAIHDGKLWFLGLLAFAGGLIATISRGPWIGALAGVLVFFVSGPRGIAMLVRISIFSIVAGSLVLISPFGKSVIDYLPFVGSIESQNVSYRQVLFEIGLQVIKQNFWFGSSDFLSLPIMQQLVQGEGIIDIVNTYLGIALSYGIVGLTCFVGAFLVAGWKTWFLVRRTHDPELRVVGQALLACLVATLVTIATTSMITVIPTVAWMLVGLNVALSTLERQLGGSGQPTPEQSLLQVPRRSLVKRF